MNWLYIVLYVIFAVLGSTLLKAGSGEGVNVLFTVPGINLPVSLMTIFGIICYGLSFILYTVLLSRLDLSFVSPVTVGAVYILLMLTAVFFFGEALTAMKISGSVLILVGLILMLIK
jgi:multidrug transporter EmrE-like cation transporter